MEQLTMRISLDIYQGGNGTLRLTEEINVNKPLTLQQAAEVLSQFSELAKAVKNR